MCLIVFAYKYHPKYPFILAGNRDEFYARPTQKLHEWNSDPKIYAGRDLKEGGTWLGINEHGKIAVLTNYRDLTKIKENAPSRGNIATNILLSNEPIAEQLSGLIPEFQKYNGFNLIAGDLHNLYYVTNEKDYFSEIQPGLYGISNAFLNTPWPKTNDALQHFTHAINGETPDEEAIFELLANTSTYPDRMLPKTGLSPEMEKAVSSIFILTDDYGTRSSALVMMNQKGEIKFTEKTYRPGSVEITDSEEYQLSLSKAQIRQ